MIDNKWRPNNFENPYLYFGSPRTEMDLISNDRRLAFEAGADVILELLAELYGRKIIRTPFVPQCEVKGNTATASMDYGEPKIGTQIDFFIPDELQEKE